MKDAIKKYFNFLWLAFIVFFVFLFFRSASAQNNLSQIIDNIQLNDFNIVPSNYYPYPNEELSAKIENANFDLTRANIVWTLNGKIIKSGRGENKINFKAGALGAEGLLYATITTPEGAIIKKVLIFNPADIDLLWQTNTYIPYFYEGKALPSGAAKIKMGAVPYFIYKGGKIAINNVFFKWFLNGNLMEQGWGKDNFEFKTPAFSGSPSEVMVEASSETKIISQKKKIVIINEKPTIKFYEYDFAYKIKPKTTFNSFSVAPGEKISILAEPFFIPKDKLSEITYEWRVNGEKTKNSTPFNVLGFASDFASYGEVRVSLKIKVKNLFEEITKNFSINIR